MTDVFVPGAGTLPLTWLIIYIVIWVLAIWDAIWKMIALWFAGKNKQKSWFVWLALLNTMGILPILYIFVFQKNPVKCCKAKK